MVWGYVILAIALIFVILAGSLYAAKNDVEGVERMENVAGAYVPVKEGVEIRELDPVLGRAISAARKTDALTPVVTSALRPSDTDSLHSVGKALDFRSRHLGDYESDAVAREMQKELGNDWDVVAEYNPPHIHVEYDPA